MSLALAVVPLAVVLAAAEALSEELLLPPHAARPMATSAMTATVSSGARLRFIFILCFVSAPFGE